MIPLPIEMIKQGDSWTLELVEPTHPVIITKSPQAMFNWLLAAKLIPANSELLKIHKELYTVLDGEYGQLGDDEEPSKALGYATSDQHLDKVREKNQRLYDAYSQDFDHTMFCKPADPGTIEGSHRKSMGPTDVMGPCRLNRFPVTCPECGSADCARYHHDWAWYCEACLSPLDK